MFNKSKLFMTAAAGVMLLGATANADTYKYDTFTNMDVDKSGFLESGEYVDYAFGKADWDNDGYLENTEWAKYTEVYYDPYDLRYEAYTHYDTDGNGVIDRVEFNNSPSASLIAAWDANDDGLIDTDEWDKVTTYYRDKE